jgi:predicted metal-dependent peptidase
MAISPKIPSGRKIKVSWADLQKEQTEIPFDEEQDIKVKRAKIKLQKEKPFFSDLLFFMKVKQEPRVSTFGVDIQGTLYYNPECSKGLTDDEVKGVLIHEVLHLALLHTQRGLNKRLNKGKLPPHEIWNLAIDCQANLITTQNGMVLPNWIGCVPRGNAVELRSKTKVIYRVEEVDKKTAEDIYIELYNNLPKEYVEYCEGDFWIPSLDEHFYEGTEKEAEKSEREWKQIAMNALYRSKSIGKLPAGMDRLINDLIEPKVPWTNKLYKFITDDIINDYTYMKPHKRSEAVDFYVPSFLKEKLSVAVFCDTSGSIADEDITDFKSECVGILNAFDNVDMIFGYCDAVVQDVYELNTGEDDKLVYSKPKGGGGTDMREIFKWLVKNEKKPDVIVILTDGYTPFPEATEVEGSKVMWVISEQGISESEFEKYQNIGEFVKMEK